MTQNKEVSIGVSIEQINEAICKFMGGYRRMGDIDIYKGPDEIEWEDGTYLKYHTDWNWLMPVVEKINQTDIPNNKYPASVVIFRTTTHINDDGYIIVETTGKTLLEHVYAAVYDFITWHNTTVKK